jgi:hypothetical protein
MNPEYPHLQDNSISSSGERPSTVLLNLIEEYIYTCYTFHPIRGPESGFHECDALGLDDLSDDSLTREAHMLRGFQQRLQEVPRHGLSEDLSIDYEVFEAHLAARLNELEVDRPFARDPHYYTDIIQFGIHYQMLFEYAGTTRDSRLQVVIKQLEDVPALMQNAIHHLQSVPLELLDYGLTCLKDAQGFIENDVSAYFAGACLEDGTLADEKLRHKITVACQAIDTLFAHLEALRDSHAPKPPFYLGEAGLAKRLRLEHGLHLPQQDPFAQILALTLAQIDENQAAFEQAARVLDPTRPADQVWAEVRSHHPRPSEVAEVLQGQVDELLRFIQQKELLTLPTDEAVVVKPSPAFMLYWYASMWGSGPYEPTPAPPAVYYASDPAGILKGKDNQSDEEAQNEFLLGMVTPELWSTSAHEAYPGHFIQGYALKQVKRNKVDTGELSMLAVCNIFMPYSFSEGWANYCEQMLREEGLLQDGDTRTYHEYLLGQRSDALLRLCRTYAGIQMHRGEMTVVEAADFFEKNAFLARGLAEVEARRGVYEPDYILYAIGKMFLLQLRTDYRSALEAQGRSYSLRQFHDTLLSLGQYPLPILRCKLLPEETNEITL